MAETIGAKRCPVGRAPRLVRRLFAFVAGFHLGFAFYALNNALLLRREFTLRRRNEPLVLVALGANVGVGFPTTK